MTIAPSAQAYMVRTVATASGTLNGLTGYGCEVSYNGSGNPEEGAIFGSVASPSGLNIPCPASPFTTPDGSSVTYSGTTDAPGDPIGRARYSTAQSNLTHGADSAAGFAVADLSTGVLRASAQSTLNTQSNAITYWNDGLSFQVTGGGAGTVTPLGVHFELHGSVTDLVRDYNSSGSVQWNMNFANASLAVQIDEGRLNWGAGAFTPAIYSKTASGWATYSFSQSSASDIVFDGVYNLVGAAATLDVRGLLQLYCKNGTSCDYSHTALMSLTLPSGVSYTSSSGVFLTTAVPEPASLVLMLAGLGGAAARQRGRGARRP